MGSVLDTTVFIGLERAAGQGPRNLGDVIGRRLAASLGADEEVAIAAITASELLHGVHRADAANRARREIFVETVLTVVPLIDFGLVTARAHARLWSELAQAGNDIGAHDRLVAATAISVGWRVATANVRHFERVPGLDVVEVR